MKNQIIKYLVDTYKPEAIITYGSYADGTANEHSDFDALIIAESPLSHDASIVSDVTLDVFIYSANVFKGEYDPEEFIQIVDGKIELDQYGIAKDLQEKVIQYIKDIPMKTKEEIQQEMERLSCKFEG